MTVLSKGHTVTQRQQEVLTMLSHRQDWSMGDVARALRISSAAATKSVIRLERKGLVTRAKNEYDRRCVTINVTHHGLETLRFFH